jgi:hypothetical protein
MWHSPSTVLRGFYLNQGTHCRQQIVMLGSSRCSLHHVHNKKLERQEIDSEESSRKVPSDKREGLRAHTYPGDKHANLSRLLAVDSSRRNLHLASASTSPLAARCIALLADAYIPGAWAQEARGDTPLHIAIRARNLQSVRKKNSRRRCFHYNHRQIDFICLVLCICLQCRRQVQCW